MKSIITYTILYSVCYVLGAYIKPDIVAPEQVNNILNNEFVNFSKDGDDNPVDRLQNQRAVKSLPTVAPPAVPSPNNSSSPAASANQTVLSTSTVNLIEKVLSNLRGRPVFTQIPDKQFLGGKLPGFLERIVQRIQNYFSVYNPPEYFDGNRPPATSNDGIAVICSNVENEDLSCNPVPADEYGVVPSECDENASGSEHNAAPPPNQGSGSEDAGYNIVVTHTVVHDNMINVYTPPDSAAGPGTHLFSNVVVILEPSAVESSPASPATIPVRNKDKFYVYVNPTAANKRKTQLHTKTDADQPQPFQPYDNATYTVIIKGDSLQEYSNNIENVDNGVLHPEIPSTFVRNLTGAGLKSYQLAQPAAQWPADESGGAAAALTSRSVTPTQLPDVPNINVVLVPPDQRANKSCATDKYENTHIEYYILKPDSGNIVKPKEAVDDDGNNNKNNTFNLHKTETDATSATYLPPQQQSSAGVPTKQPALQAAVQQGASKFPLLFNLFKKKPEEPRSL